MLGLFGFSSYDIYLVLACTGGAVIGSLSHAMMQTISVEGPPVDTSVFSFADAEVRRLRGYWLFMRMFVGGVLGFVFGLYFVGALHETPATFAKIWALSFVVGYAAPKLWQVKEASVLIAAKSAQVGKQQG